MSRLLADCETAVRRALRGGARAAEAFGLREGSSSIQVEKGALTAAEWNESTGLGLRVVRDARVGFAYATRPEEVPDAIEAALRAARTARPLPRFSFAAPKPAPSVAGLYDPRVARLESVDLLEFGGLLLDAVAARGPDLLVAGGGADASTTEWAVANSEGLARSHRDTGLSGSLYVVRHKDGVSTGFANAQSTRRDVDWQRLGDAAATLCLESARARPLARSGRLPCVIRPDPAGDLLSTITIPSLYGKPVHRGESYYAGKRGRRIAHARLSLVEDPRIPRGVGSTPVDDEGVPTRSRRLIDRGVLRSFLYDRHDAAQFNGEPTASALRIDAFSGRSFKSPPGTAAHQVRLEAPRTTTEKLVASVDDGLLLHDLMGVHTANVASGDFSVTSSVLFRIRKGAVEHPVAPLSVAGNLHEALARDVRLGDDVKMMGGGPALALPSVLFDGFAVTP